MDEARAEQYLARIGASRPREPSATALSDLMHRHLRHVPFENLSIHLGEPIRLDEESLLAKIVDRRRGGFCYELNGAFALLLTHLGYDVTLLAARVFGDAGPGFLYDHLTLRVPCRDSSGDWLVDVGFGRFALAPVRLDVRADQVDEAGVFRVVETGDGDLDVLVDAGPQLRVEQRPRVLTDFVPTCWWHQTSPDSHFTQGPTCSLPTPDGRVTISGRTLVRTDPTGRHESVIEDDDDLVARYRELFGVELDQLPG